MLWTHKAAILLTLASAMFAGQESNFVVIPPNAEHVEKAHTGVWFSPGCDTAKFTIKTAYPGTSALRAISDELRRRGFIQVTKANRRFLLRPSDAMNRWESFVSVAGSISHVRSEQWTSATGDLASYSFGYYTQEQDKMDVQVEFCPSAVVEKYRCGSQDWQVDLKPSLPTIKITKIEPTGKDFKIFFRVANEASSPVLIAHEGERNDGTPDLRVSIEQEENGKWGYVGNVCLEHPPFDHLVLSPGNSIESWVMAVDFPSPHQRFGLCSRSIGRLRGKIRVSLNSYRQACEVYDWLKSPGAFVSSQPVSLPPTNQQDH
jgi:hypothetical protein